VKILIPFLALSLATLAQTPVPPGTNAAGASILITWTDYSQSEDGFIVERAPKPATGSAPAASFREIARVTANVTRHVDEGLPYATAFSYRIRAFSTAGVSDPSNVSTETTAARPIPRAPGDTKAAKVPLPPN